MKLGKLQISPRLRWYIAHASVSYFVPLLFRFLPAEVRCIDLKKAAQEAAVAASAAVSSLDSGVLESVYTRVLQSLPRRGRGMCELDALLSSSPFVLAIPSSSSLSSPLVS